MKTGIGAVLTGIFLLAALLLLSAFNLTKPRILVLHSSDRNSTTVKKLDEGIRQTLDKNRQPVSVRWHYLGIDSLPDESHRRDAAKEGRRALDQFDPDILIAVDDEAQEYLARAYAGRARPKIVFTAIDHDPKEYGYVGPANVSGIVETLPLAAIRDALLQSRQGKPARIAVLGDTGLTGKGQLEQITAFNWAPHSVVALHSVADFAAWQAAVKSIDGKADAVLVLSYESLQASPAAPKLTPRTEIARWTESNSKPLPIGISVSYVEQGGGLSIAPSAFEMGESAIANALAGLKGKPPERPSITQSVHYSVALRAAALNARGAALPSIYIEAARHDQLYFP